MTDSRFSTDLVPIQIRADCTVYIQGLPRDLTKAEALKIAAVVMALHEPAGVSTKE